MTGHDNNRMLGSHCSISNIEVLCVFVCVCLDLTKDLSAYKSAQVSISLEQFKCY